jgi:drug/metabolite transporter (DMT)-like permease
MSSTQTQEQKKIGYLYMFLGIFFFATIEITAKIITSFSKLQQHFIRIILGVFVISVMIYYRRGNIDPLNYLRYHWKLILAAAIIWITIASPVFFFALNFTNASTAALLLASNPIIVSIGSMLFLGESKTKIKFIAVIIGFLGALIIITEFQFGGLEVEEIMGNLLVFFAVFGYSFYTLVSIYLTKKTISSEEDTKSSREKFDLALEFNFWGFLLGVIFLIPFFLFDLIIFNPITFISELDVILLLYLGIFTTGLAYILYTLGINKVEPSRGVLLFYSKPIIAMLLAGLFLQESLTIYFIIGFCLIFIAVIISEWEKSRLAKKKGKVELMENNLD